MIDIARFNILGDEATGYIISDTQATWTPWHGTAGLTAATATSIYKTLTSMRETVSPTWTSSVDEITMEAYEGAKAETVTVSAYRGLHGATQYYIHAERIITDDENVYRDPIFTAEGMTATDAEELANTLRPIAEGSTNE